MLPNAGGSRADDNDTVEEETTIENSDDPYFAEYSEWSVHELMLKDAPRTSAYRDAIEGNAHLFRGKTVMDVGCGTGILSLFCARAGAAKVVAVEASRVANLAEQIVKKNGFESVVQVVNKKIEEMEGFDDLEVDIIVSEWMGFYLLHESMLDTVIYARDKWLKKETGLLFPSIAYLYMCPVDLTRLHSESVSSWSNFYGFDFSPVASLMTATRLSTPSVEIIEESQLLSEAQILASLDLKTIDREEVASIFETLEFEVEEPTKERHSLTSALPLPPSSTSSSFPSTPAVTPTKRPFHGFACWFDCLFATGLPSPAKPVTLSTRPGSPSTHWKQTVLWLPGGEPASVSVGDSIGCHVTLTQSDENPRHYDICVDLKADDEEEEDDGECDFEGKDHPVPCDCGAARCVLVKTLLEKYAAEETERLEAQAELVGEGEDDVDELE